MTIIFDQLAVPDKGTFEVHQTVTIGASAEEAQRTVDTWLLNEVSYMMGAYEPDLVIGDRAVWRVPVYFSATHVGEVGTVGYLSVDALTGSIVNPEKYRNELLQQAEERAESLPPYETQSAIAPEYLAKDVQPTHEAGCTQGDLLELVASFE